MRNRLIITVVGFLFITGPGAVDSWWSLIQKLRGNEPPMIINISSLGEIYSLLFPILGLAVLLFGIWWTRPSDKTQTGGLFTGLRRGKREAPDDTALSYLSQLFRSEIAYVHFGWLWKDEPYIQFGIKVQNLSPWSIRLEGVSTGPAHRVEINNTTCTRDAELMRADPFPPQMPTYGQATIQQPLSETLATALPKKLQDGPAVPFDLSRVTWVGKVTLPNGEVDIPMSLPCAYQFDVDGKRISSEHSQAGVQRNRLEGSGPEVKKL